MSQKNTPRSGSAFMLSAGLVAVTVIYALWQNFAPHTSTTQTTATTAVATVQTNSLASAAPTPVAYTDGSYTGNATDAFYGTVQVKAIISGGKISDVQFLQYPSDRSTSANISSRAMPALIQEAIQSQSANVQIVSGATQTSSAFQTSLASALALATH